MLALCSFVLYGCSLLAPRTDGAPLVLPAPERHIGPRSSISCDVCRTVSSALELYLEEERSEEEITQVLAGLCVLFRINDKHLCDAFVKEYKVGKLIGEGEADDE